MQSYFWLCCCRRLVACQFALVNASLRLWSACKETWTTYCYWTTCILVYLVELVGQGWKYTSLRANSLKLLYCIKFRVCVEGQFWASVDCSRVSGRLIEGTLTHSIIIASSSASWKQQLQFMETSCKSHIDWSNSSMFLSKLFLLCLLPAICG